ncbi:tRNA pseudouridine synthase [Emericellopsis atlantica]|uniref:tRNA pseudouridine synthase 1 n=1 Tax=Emericellopsis atlantica TaxID=2614577 RepID=A0A9P7ZRW6_9HYPO|nr:tRNA pseudouridine synthase [Emericellopsis atlantica]KAG9257169.1 tRNA pseudouridine synthase [Emericellopsis atlantica]
MADTPNPPTTSDAKRKEPSDGNGGERTVWKNPRQSGHKRSRMGKNKNLGRAEYDNSTRSRKDYHDRKRIKTTKDGETFEEAPKPNPFFTEEEIAAESKRPKRKVAVMVGYSGSGYKGMQINGDEPTIERDLFRAFIRAGAISKANANDPRKSSLVRCARTDKGVHAAGNVISLKLIVEDDDIKEKINSHLPDQIRVWGIQRTNNAFSCYQGCDSRWYEYLLPSSCLLPPHPNTWLAKEIARYAQEQGYEETLAQLNADVASFWSDTEANNIKPVLDSLDPQLRAQVLEHLHIDDALVESDNEKAEKHDEEVKDKKLEPQTGIALQTFSPKKRQLGPLDFALKDVKAGYVAAKRRYRVSQERMQRLQDILHKYVGTHIFHNYTVQKNAQDPSARRHIKSFELNPKPIIIGDTEWLSLKVHGQSFMMHQIRKMVGLATLMVRCGTPLERVEESYKAQKMAIPKAPGLGLLLERPVFEGYNRKALEIERETIDFGKYEEELLAFKEKHIYQRIFETEEQENLFHAFYNQIDQFKANHFLWLTAGGLDVAKLDGVAQADVDKQLEGDGEDEDEDPENGEG